MSIQKIYDHVSKHYNQQLSANVLNEANQQALELLLQNNVTPEALLALGIGDGAYIKPYQKKFPKLSIGGIDISANMLKKAHDDLGCDIYHGDIAKTQQLVQDKKFDLAVAHFVCAYVKPEIICHQAHQVLNDEGHISIVTNTFESFPKVFDIYNTHLRRIPLLGSKISAHIDKTLDHVFVPNDFDALRKIIENESFVLVEHKELTIEITFDDVNECYEFFLLGGWFASGLLHDKLPASMIKWLSKKLAMRYMTFPFTDTLSISISLARKVDKK